MLNENIFNRFSTKHHAMRVPHWRKTKILLLAALGLSCGFLPDCASAQDIRIVDGRPIWRPVPRCTRCWPRPPIIEIPNIKRDEVAIEIGSYAIDAQVDGLYAKVTTEFTVINKNARDFEGELEFPLPDGATISGYAIDINGVMVDARVVEKEKARIAFEAEVKKGTDPGFVEQIQGNAYRTRIYPIPRNGFRRIRVEYITPLMLNSAGDAALALPMPRAKLPRRDVKISVNIPGINAPLISGLGDDRFKSAKAMWVVESHEKDITPGDDILVAMPQLPQTIAVIENTHGDNFFMASVQMPAQPDKGAKMPASFRIIWDASGSRKSGDIEAARKVLAALPPKSTFELHVFRNALEPVKTFKSLENLIEYIDSLDYDGGTDFSPLKKIASQKFSGATLFFTDGLDTYTNALPQFGAGSMALISGAQHDTPAMRHICGGRVLDLSVLSTEEVIHQIANPSPVISQVTGSNLSDIQGIGLPALGRVTVTGRYKGSPGNITLELSNGQKIKTDMSKASKSEGKTIATAWAASRVEELSPSAETHREELLALGRYFSIVSPVSSMIVFERLSQWLDYNIEPPESLTDIHAQWLKKHKSEAQIKEDEQYHQTEWLDTLKEHYQTRLKWWTHKRTKLKFKKMKECYDDGECDIYYTDQFGNEYDADADGNVIVDSANAPDDIGWTAFDASPEASSAGYGLGSAGGDALSRRSPAPRFEPAAQMAPAPRPAANQIRLMDAGSNAPVVQGSRGHSINKLMEMHPQEPSVTDASGHDSSHTEGDIILQAWDPNTPYLTAIQDAAKIYKDSDSLYSTYLRQRAKYADSPAFYLDCAGLFLKENKRELALRILSNLAELKLDNVSLLRVYAWRLREAGEFDHAIVVLRKVLKLRPDEAVSWRDLALTLTMRAKKTKRAEDVQEALECYHKAAFTYHARNDAMWTALVAVEEFNALLAWSKRQKLSGKVNAPKIDPAFEHLLDTDLRIVMMWDTDNTDIDLHVVEPSGEEIYYDHQNSRHRGLISHDVTTGYGPEEYLIKHAPKGQYLATTKYFASHEQKLVGPATVTAFVYTNWGRANEDCKITSVRLETEQEIVKIGDVTIK
ncbi:MAG: DUF2135 domain-containing protein [Proteobacteria bacterium]|nr:DUF2135 domain-containing protein [Pseudomonadota bacterium]